MDNVDNMKEHMGNVSKDKKTLRNSQQEMSANQKHRNKWIPLKGSSADCTQLRKESVSLTIGQ